MFDFELLHQVWGRLAEAKGGELINRRSEFRKTGSQQLLRFQQKTRLHGDTWGTLLIRACRVRCRRVGFIRFTETAATLLKNRRDLECLFQENIRTFTHSNGTITEFVGSHKEKIFPQL